MVLDAFDFDGPITIISNACASGSNAIGHAWGLIRTGQSEAVLAGGYDALSQLVFSGFNALQALSPTVDIRWVPLDRLWLLVNAVLAGGAGWLTARR